MEEWAGGGAGPNMGLLDAGGLSSCMSEIVGGDDWWMVVVPICARDERGEEE